MEIEAPVELKALFRDSQRLIKELQEFLTKRNVPLTQAFVALRTVRTQLVVTQNCPVQEVDLLESLSDGVVLKKTPTVVGQAALKVLSKRIGLG